MTWIYYVDAPTNSTGRIIRGNNPSAISGCPDIPGFLLLDDLANELLLSAGLGTDRILTCDRRIFYGGGQLGEDVAVRLVAVNQSELIEIMTTNSTSANAIPIRQRIATDHILNNNADNTVAVSTR